MEKTSTLHYFAFLLVLGLLLLSYKETTAQCSISANAGALNLGNINPTGTWQTTGCITGGDYFTFNATAGQQFTFTLCSNGGSATWDTELSINNASNAGIAGAYNDDFCGIQSQLVWTATTTGTFSIYLTGFGCANNTTCAFIAYRVVTPPPPPTAVTIQTGGNNSNPSWLVQNVFVTGCAQVSNINFTGNPNSIGAFTNGASLGMPNGIIISSGNVTTAQGPNNSGSAGTGLGSPGAPILQPLIPGYTLFDAAVLTFSFTPLTSSVSFQYVFGSEEYPEWVSSSFNDVFGFFIQGPGVPLQNIALVPGTSLPVSIDNVNAGNNNIYYVANPTGSIITQFDGYTTLLTATASGLTPCQTYTITLAVADAGDSIFDSAVFLAGNSFNAGNAVAVSAFVPSTGTVDAYEGCQDGYFEFTRSLPTDLTQPIVFNITVSGVATPGVDYAPLPSQVVIPPGQMSVQVPVTAFADLFVEGFESIIVQANVLLCNCTNPPPAQLNIYDSPEPFNSFISNPPTICPGEQALIAVIASGSTFTPYTYLWSNGTNGPATFVSPVTTTTYSVTVTDACGRTTTANVQVNVSNAPPNAAIAPAGPFCGTDAPVTLSAASVGGTWSGPGVNPTTGVFDPAVALASGAGPYTITYSVSNSCGASTQSIQIVVNPVGIPTINPVSAACSGATGNITLTASLPGGTWSGPGILGGTNTSGQFSFALAAGSGTGPYTITYTIPPPCGGSATQTITINPAPNPSLPPVTSGCNGDSATLTASGGGTYLWSNGATTASITVTPAATTTYSVTVTDVNGCSGTASSVVVVNTITPPTLVSPSICSGSSATLNAGGGYTNYLWSTGATSQTINVNPTVTTSYQVTVTNAAGCTASGTATVNISSNIVPPNLQPQATCQGTPISLNAGTGFTTYLWSQGSNTQSITVNPATTTTYTVTVTNADGCSATSNATITVNTITPPTISPAQVCAGSAVSITASGGPYTGYTWSNGATGATISVSPASNATYTVTVTNAQGCTATASGAVTVNNITPPTPPPFNTCQGNSVTLTLPGSFTYNWSDGLGSGASVTVTPTASTTYTVTVTNAQGCSTTISVPVGVNALPTPSIGGSTTFCTGGNTTLSVSGFASQVWAPGGSTNSSITVTTAGVYAVTVTDANGCTGSNQVTVTQAANLNPAITGDLTLCSGETTTLDAGAGFATYIWSGGLGNTQTITNVPVGGPYSVTVSDAGGCTGTAAVTVTANPQPTVTATPNNPTICPGVTSTITATPAGYIEYAWSNGSFGQSITVSTPGTYTVTITDVNNCTAVGSATISEVIPTIPPVDYPSCINEPLTLNGPAGYNTYNWSNGASGQNITITPAGPATFTVTVTNALGCTAVSNHNINIVAQPVAVIDPYPPICAGDLILLGASGGDNYTWSNGDNGFIIAVQPQTTTTYTVTVSIGNCISTASRTIIVNPIPTPTAAPVPPICSGQSANLSASGGQVYNWGPGLLGQNVTVSPTATTTYTVTVTDSNGCSNTAATTVTVNPLPVPNLTPPQTICAGASVTLVASGGDTYNWDNGANTGSISVSPATTTTYNVTVTDAAGCSSTATTTITVNGIPDAVPDNNGPVCSGEDLQLTAEIFMTGGVPGGSNISYSWTGPNGFTSDQQLPIIPNASAAESGTYTLVVTVNGCPSAPNTTLVTILETPTAIPTNNGPACADDVQLFGNASVSGPSTWLWTGPNGFTSTLQNPTLFGATAASGTYTLVATVNGCPSEPQTTDVVVNPLPTVAIGGIPVICPGGSTTLQATGGYTQYAWSIGFNGASIGNSANINATTGGIYVVTVTDANGCQAVQDITVTVGTNPSFTVDGGTICEGDTLTLVSPAGYPLYAWSNGLDTKNIDAAPTTTTTYSVTVTDAAGCSGSASATVNVNAAPPLDIVGNSSICLGNSAILTAQSTPGYNYVWSNGATAPAIPVSPTPVGDYTYSVTVTNPANSCSATDSFVLNVGSNLTPPPINATICAGGSATLNAGTFDTYLWDTGATTQTITVSPTTSGATYTVSVSDATGCTGSTTATVTINNNPTVDVTGVQSCGNPAVLDATPGFVSYLWNNSATTPQVSVTIGGTYVVTVTDGNGCTASDNFVVTPQPNPNLTLVSANDGTCGNANGSITVSGTGGTGTLTYAWSHNAGLNSSTANGLSANTYTVTITDTNGCSATQSATIGNIAGPVITAMTPTNASCSIANGNISVTTSGGTSPLNYVWSHNATLNSPDATAINTGSYTITVTDANNCTTTQTASITNLTGPTLALGTVTNAACGVADGTASVVATGGTAPLSYSWSNNPGLNSPNATGLAAGSYIVTVTDANGCTDTEPVAVANDGAPTLNIGTVANATCGNSNGSVTTVVSGGTGTITYSWSHNPGLNSPDATDLSAGDYFVTITDENSCIEVETVTIINIAGPTLQVTTIGTDFCGNGVGSLTVTPTGGTAPFNYTWSAAGAPNNPTITGLTAGSYSVTITDDNGCTATQTATVPATTNPTLTVTNETPASCAANDGTATVSATGGVLPYTYSWQSNPGLNAPAATGLAAGSYGVTVTDNNGCTASTTVNISQLNTPTLILDGTTNATCNQNNGTATVSGSGGVAPYTYAWSNNPGLNNPTATGLAAGTTYTVSLTDAANCTISIDVSVSADPVPSVLIDVIVPSTCGDPNGSMSVLPSGGEAPYSYSWSGNPGLNSTTNTNLAAGNYTVTLTDGNGCTATVTGNIATSAPPLVTQGATTNASCGLSNGSMTFTVSGGTAPYSYLWSHDDTVNAPTATGIASGSYTVTVTDANGCTSFQVNSIGDTTPPTLAVNNVTDATCGQNNGSITFSASGGTGSYTYNWSPNTATGPSASGLGQGSYSVTVTDGAGCTATLSADVAASDAPVLAIGSTTDATCGDANGSITFTTTNGTAPYSYSWSNAGGTNSPTQSGLVGGTYSVTVTDDLGCTAGLSATITTSTVPVLAVGTITPASCGQADGSANVTVSSGTGPYSYTWAHAPGLNSPDAPDLAVGTYNVTVTDALGCTDDLSLTVNTLNGPVLSLVSTNPALCGNDNGSITFAASGGTGALSYQWSHNAALNSLTATDLAPGSYTITVADENGCTNLLSATVTAFDSPAASLAATGSACGLTDGTATATVTGGTAPFSYAWSYAGAPNSPDATGLAPGDYSVTVTDANNCTATADVTVPGNMPPPAPTCGLITNTSLEFVWAAVPGATGYEISIDGGAPETLPAGTTAYTVPGLAQGATVTITISALGPVECGNSVTVSQSCTTLSCPALTPEILGLAATYCVDASAVTLSGNPEGGTFSGAGISGNSFDPATAGVGTHIITYDYSPDGFCLYSNTQPVTVVDLPVAAFTAPATICLGEQATFVFSGAAAAGSTYNWNFGNAGTQTGTGPHNVSWNSPGNYNASLQVTTPDGCTAQTSAPVGVSSVNVTATTDPAYVNTGQSAQLTAAATSALNGSITYTWTLTGGNISCTDCPNPIASPVDDLTTYTVTALDEFGCQATASVNVGVIYQKAVIIPNAFSPNGDGENDVFRLSGINVESVNLYIYDRWGGQMFQMIGETIEKGWDGVARGKEAELGVYVYYAEVTYTDGTTEFFKGNVTLIR
ncbi:MAG TPA: choice-of-anchor L domain-containing protein [Chitinophagales bacterium]|nr:choice-of-anchor L domain-containing protein [Chitinophagales bacterium]HRK26612.1 choice-of-anchor L domain-containing protein [Chitinophagales bacterium]